MSLRSITREQSDFVVRFVTDGSVMVRQKQHIYTDGKVKEGEIYSVKWGTTEAAASDAMIIASGDYVSMAARARMEKEGNRNESPRSPTPPPTKRQKIQQTQKKQPSSPKVPPSRRKLIKSVTKSGKPPARVLMVVSPIRSPIRPRTSTPITAREKQPRTLQFTANRPPPATQTQTPVAAPSLPSPLSPVFQLTRPGPMNQQGPTASTLSAILASLSKLHKHNDVIDKRLTDIEVQITKINSKVDHILTRPTTQAAPIPVDLTDNSAGLDGIPEMYHIPANQLLSLESRTKGAGNFAAHITKWLFPELFGVDNLRFWYNWFGGGKHGKRELDPARREVIKRYTHYYFPSARREETWRSEVVPKINELLRRPTEKRKITTESVEDDDPERQHHQMDEDDYSPYTEFQFGEL